MAEDGLDRCAGGAAPHSVAESPAEDTGIPSEVTGGRALCGDDEFERFIDFQYCWNFRDIGGYRTAGARRVRWRKLFRSGEWGGASASDLVRARNELRIRTVIDLRKQSELERRGTWPRDDRSVRFHHLPIFRDESFEAPGEPPPVVASLGDAYIWMLRGMGTTLVEILDLLAHEESYPLIFHCMGGKDRTGIVAAIVLSLLEVPESVIVEDYALTEQLRLRQSREALEAGLRFLREEKLPDFVAYAKPESMLEFLGGVRSEYGSVLEYVRSIGVGRHVVASLQECLLD